MFKRTLNLAVLILFTSAVNAKTLNFGVPFAPGVSETPSDPIPAFIKRLGELGDLNLNPRIIQFKRMMMALENNQFDLVLVAYFPSKDSAQSNFQYTKSTFWEVNMVLYTHKDKPLDTTKLHQYKIGTERIHTEFFNFPIIPMTDVESAIRMVNSKRLDGFIFAEPVVDATIRGLKLKNIHRQQHSTLQIKGLMRRNQQTSEIDNAISKAMNIMTQSGELAEITASWTGYNDWQPHTMDW